MKVVFALFAIPFLTISISSTAQTADAIYQQACGPRDAQFDVKYVKEQRPAGAEPGKALVYFIQDAIGQTYTARVGLDGAWVGAFKKSAHFFISAKPGEHHGCVSFQNMKYRRPVFISVNLEAGNTYYYLVRSLTGPETPDSLEISPVDSDEALS